MITDIEIEGFKSFERVSLKLGRLNLFIGTNSSGKSNFLEALRVLQGIAYGFTVDEILNGKPKSATSEVWEGIRGGSGFAAYKGRDRLSRGIVRFRVAGTSKGEAVRYAAEIAPERGQILSESLGVGPGDDVELSGPRNRPELSGALLKHLGNGEAVEVAKGFIQALENMQHLAPSPAVLRSYSQARLSRRMGEHGENFAAVVKSILEDEALGKDYLAWLQQLTPTELDDIEILLGALQEPLFALAERGIAVPAPVLSDGTLYFAALVAAFFQPDMPALIAIEEIENGIHPSRLRVIMELLRSQSDASGPQVFASTHSPVVLAWLEEEDYATTFFCKKQEASGASEITPLREIPRLVELLRTQPISDLFTEGWLEGAA